jgi:phenylpropionate dioxygenase-like ring-hydroxylating dioxygenase large terminal subunit
MTMAEADAPNLPAAPQVRRDYVPAADYSPEFHRKEIELLWPRVWQPASRLEEIPEVGDYVNYEIGEESILVLRSAPGTVKAFYNVCPHRGRRLRDDERGNVGIIFCGYHA